MKRNAIAWAALAFSVAAFVGSRGVSKPATAVQEIPAEGQKTARALSEAFHAVAEFARPSVVQITVQKKAGANLGRSRAPGRGQLPDNVDPKDLEDMLKRFFGPGQTPKFEKQQFGVAEGTGSGFVYDDKGHILTNNHVVSGAERIVVTFHDGETAPAKVVGTDPKADVAVIQVETTSYPALPRGDSEKLKVGEWVIAVGSPFGLEQTVTSGIISATERGNLGIIGEDGSYENFLQTDAAINPGNSGGPLIDMNGRVVGINTAIATGNRTNAGVGFAIPIDMAGVLADKLIKDGKVNRMRVGLKLAMQPLTPTLARKLGVGKDVHGVVVDEVVADSPGAKAGIQPGDVIVEFQGHPVHNVAGFRNLVSASDEGKSYAVRLFRDGKPTSVTVTPAPEDSVQFAFEKEAQKLRAGQTKLEPFGFSVQPVKPADTQQLGYPEGTEGLMITGVKDGMPAANAGLEEGDLITKVIKDKKIEPAKSVEDLVSAANGAKDLAIFVKDVRNPEKEAQIVTLTIKAEKSAKQEKNN